MSTGLFYAESGINWIFVYEVMYEDNEILCLKDLGRYHKFDKSRSFEHPITAWVDVKTKDYIRINEKVKLVEVSI
jgi:hypothetical protein